MESHPECRHGETPRSHSAHRVSHQLFVHTRLCIQDHSGWNLIGWFDPPSPAPWSNSVGDELSLDYSTVWEKYVLTFIWWKVSHGGTQHTLQAYAPSELWWQYAMVYLNSLRFQSCLHIRGWKPFYIIFICLKMNHVWVQFGFISHYPHWSFGFKAEVTVQVSYI